jgi:hypothetical protein
MEDQRIIKFHFAVDIAKVEGHCRIVFDKMLTRGPAVSNQILSQTFA